MPETAEQLKIRQLEHLNAVLNTMRQVNQLITHGRNADLLLKNICQQLAKTRGYLHAWIILGNHEQMPISHYLSGGTSLITDYFTQPELNPLPDCVAKAMDHHGTLVLHDPSIHCNHCPIKPDETGYTTMICRIAHEQEIFGVIAVAVPTCEHHTEEEPQLISDVAADLGYALFNLRQEQQRRKAERLLADSEQRFRTLFENMPSAVAIYEVIEDGNDFVFRDFNRTAEKAERITRDQLIGKRVTEVFPGIKEFGLFEVFQQVWRTNQDAFFPETAYVDERLGQTWRENRVFKISTNTIVAIYNDVTLRKQQEIALAESESRFRRLAENARDIIFRITIPDGLYQYISPACRQITGYTQDQFMEDPQLFFRLVHPNDLAYIREQWQHIQAGRNHLSLEYRIITRDRQTRWIHQRNVIVTDKHGTPIAMEGIVTDMTERKRTEQALKQSNNFIKSLLAAIPTPVFYKDTQGRYLGCNDAFTQLMGVTTQEILGKTVEELWPSDMAKVYHEKDLELINNPQHQAYEFKLKDRFGQVRPVIFAKDVFRDADGLVAGLVGAFLDISDLKKAEAELKQLVDELQAKNAELERFAYTVSHDMKSPLITILGFIGSVKQQLNDIDNPQIHSDLARIRNAAKRMNDLLNDLLEISRIGRIVNDPVPAPMTAIAEDAVELLNATITNNNVTVNIQPEMPTVMVDRPRMIEVIQNLVENAIRYACKNDQSTIDIGCRDTDGHSVFYVADHGPGIAPAYHQTVFGMFNQLIPDNKGTGIGLALVQRIIEFHNGRIWIESEGNNDGACFCFTIGQTDTN